jgi:hypothetical protein
MSSKVGTRKWISLDGSYGRKGTEGVFDGSSGRSAAELTAYIWGGDELWTQAGVLVSPLVPLHLVAILSLIVCSATNPCACAQLALVVIKLNSS